MKKATGNHPGDPDSELPLSPAVFHILLALADEERHGYGIMQEVRLRTDGQVNLVPGTLYGAIKRLLEKGIIEEAEEREDPQWGNERRRYYRLTDFGLRVLTADAERMARNVALARSKRLLPGSTLSPFAAGYGGLR